MKNGDEHTIGHDQVRTQLETILSSEKFGNSLLLSMFLKFIVEETLAGRVNAIKEYTIATQVLGRPVDFNPQTDAVVRIHAGRLRRLLSDYYRKEGANDPVLIEIPKGSYVPTFKEHLPAPASESITSVGTDGSRVEEAITAPHRKVGLAVFPFQNLSGDKSHDRFVESTGEQLSSDFAKFQHVSVISYYSMNKIAVEKKDISDIHKVYGVDYVITGSIRFSKKIVQVNVQFVCAETGTLAWTQTFIHPHNTANLYTIQDAIIEQVVNKIADVDGLITSNVINGPLTPKKDVFGIYYAAYQYFGLRTKYDTVSYKQARSALELAVVTDPQNSLMWALLANLFLNNYIFQFEASTDDVQRACDYAERATWLDPNSQYALQAMTWVYLLTGKTGECMESIERCLDLNPRALSVVGNMGFILVCLGKPQQAFRLFLRSMHLNLSTAWYVGIGFALYYYNNGEYQEAVNWIDRTPTSDFPLKSLIRQAANKRLKDLEEKESGAARTIPPASPIAGTDGAILNQYIYDARLKENLLQAIGVD